MIERVHRLGHHELGDRIDQAELDREPDQIGRRLDGAALVAPADERLESDHLVAAQVDLGLERTTELLIADRQAQPLLELHARRHRLAHVAVEQGDAALAAALGLVHRAVGVAAQRLVAVAVLGVDADADRGRGEHLEALEIERLLQGVEQLIDGGLQLVGAADRLDQQHELVAADPRQHIGLADAACDPRGDLDQQRVAHGMAVVVVDVLEIVEIDERHREAAVAAFAREQAFDMLLDERAFRESSELVAIGALPQFVGKTAQLPAFRFRLLGLAHRHRRRRQQREFASERDLIEIEIIAAGGAGQDQQTATAVPSDGKLERRLARRDQVARQAPAGHRFLAGKRGRRCRARGPAATDQLLRQRGNAVKGIAIHLLEHDRSIEREHLAQRPEDDRERVVRRLQQRIERGEQQLPMPGLVPLARRRDRCFAAFVRAVHHR